VRHCERTMRVTCIQGHRPEPTREFLNAKVSGIVPMTSRCVNFSILGVTWYHDRCLVRNNILSLLNKLQWILIMDEMVEDFVNCIILHITCMIQNTILSLSLFCCLGILIIPKKLAICSKIIIIIIIISKTCQIFHFYRNYANYESEIILRTFIYPRQTG